MSDSQPHREYTRSIVSFIDLLGFKSIVADPESDADSVWRILDLVRYFGIDRTDGQHAMDAASMVFSDSIIRARPVAAFNDPLDALFAELDILSSIQMELTFKGFLVRGGVTIGDVFIRPHEGIVFGPAYIRAYELESKVAVYPRIIIDDSVVEEIRAARETTDHTEEDKERVSGYLLRDEARCSYLDYLRNLQPDEPSDRARFIESHRDLIASRLAEHEPTSREYRKYAWLAEYHNAFIRERFKNEVEATELLIP